MTALIVWNDFFTQLVFFGGGANNRTLPVAIYSFVGEYESQWNVVFAALAPVLCCTSSRSATWCEASLEVSSRSAMRRFPSVRWIRTRAQHYPGDDRFRVAGGGARFRRRVLSRSSLHGYGPMGCDPFVSRVSRGTVQADAFRLLGGHRPLDPGAAVGAWQRDHAREATGSSEAGPHPVRRFESIDFQAIGTAVECDGPYRGAVVQRIVPRSFRQAVPIDDGRGAARVQHPARSELRLVGIHSRFRAAISRGQRAVGEIPASRSTPTAMRCWLGPPQTNQR